MAKTEIYLVCSRPTLNLSTYEQLIYLYFNVFCFVDEIKHQFNAVYIASIVFDAFK